jgi:hypothetical protein
MKNRSCTAPREVKNGAAKAARMVTKTKTVKPAEALVRVATRQGTVGADFTQAS